MFRKLLIMILSFFILVSCHSSKKNVLRVGTIDGPETELMETAKSILKKEGIDLEIISFSDYQTPNAALADGSIDANMFQHVPYLQSQIKAHNYKLVVIGKTFIYPMGLYSAKITHLNQLKDGARVAIPNDPSNGARALLLLQAAHLIELRSGVTITATPFDVEKNPKRLSIVELDAAQLPRALSDVDMAAINTNFAVPAGLSPTRNALFSESKDSLYANIVVARENNQNDPRLKALVNALHSKEVVMRAKQLFGDAAIPAW